jgi:hypothetical protein
MNLFGLTLNMYSEDSEFTKEILEENISINLTPSQKNRWKKLKADLKRYKLRDKLNAKAREKIISTMDEAEAWINEYKKKNLILP